MRSYVDCIHCYLKQVVSCMRLADIEEERQHQILYELMEPVKGFDRHDTPAVNSTKILWEAYRLIGSDDPYRRVKKESNDLALGLYPAVKALVEKAEDPLYQALKVAVAGNVIDLGINRSFDIDEGLRHSLEVGFSLDHYQRFREKLDHTGEVLILGDNSGEIVFDRILVEELGKMGKQVTYAVKSSPILNDATVEDARYTGMDLKARVVENGSGYLGTCLETLSPEFRQKLKETELVISKGQANFETLEQEEWARDRVFFLLKIKCEEVGQVAGAAFGDVVFFCR